MFQQQFSFEKCNHILWLQFLDKRIYMYIYKHSFVELICGIFLPSIILACVCTMGICALQIEIAHQIDG